MQALMIHDMRCGALGLTSLHGATSGHLVYHDNLMLLIDASRITVYSLSDFKYNIT